MDHRRGQRWPSELTIRITADQTTIPRQARLLDLSHHGACLRLPGGCGKAGETLSVWLPKREKPIRALVVHTQGDILGLLWIEYSPWVDQLLAHVIKQTRQPQGNRPITQGTPVYASQLTGGFDLPRTLAGMVTPNKQRRR